MLADLIREFGKENNYEIYENYTKTISTPLGEETYTTIGIVVKPARSILSELADFLEAKGFTNLLELEGVSSDEFGPDAFIYYFPAIQDYQPLQP